MPVAILRPDATHISGGANPVGAGTIHGALSDASDGSYIQDLGTTHVHLNSFALNGAVVTGWQVFGRARDTSAPNPTFYVQISNQGSYYPGDSDAFTYGVATSGLTGSFANYNGPFKSANLSQAQLDGLIMLCAFEPISTGANIADIWLQVSYANPPSAPTVSLPSGAQTGTRRPNISWTHNAGADGGGQSGYQYKIFSAAQYGAGGFNPDTSPSTIDSGIINFGTSFTQVQAPLANGTSYRAYVRTKATVMGIDQWSPWGFSSFNIAIPVPTPTSSSLVPSQGSTVTTSRPAVGVIGNGMADGIRTKREWDIASNNTFTINKQTITETTLSTTPTGTIAFPAALTRLAQGVWYIRARQIDEYGNAGAYTATASFTVSHIPTTFNRQPSGGVSRQYTTTPQVSWSFSDIDTSDFQTKYEAELWKLSTPGTVKTTGQVTSAASTATFTGLDATWKDTELRWRVRVADQDAVWSDWSIEQAFFLRDLPTVTITSPANNGTVTNSQPTITWTFAASAGRTQASYRVLVTNVNTGQVVADSGVQLGTALSWEVPTPVVLVGPDYTVQVLLTDSTGLVGQDTNAFDASYAAPTTPVFTIDGSDYANTAKVHLDWSSTQQDPTFQVWRVYRRIEGDNEWTLVADNLLTKSYDDYLAPSDTPLEYAVVQVALSFGEPVESGYPVNSFQGQNEHYYIVCPDDTSLNMLLYNVTADSFSDEQEMAHLNLIGRGRRVEYGTRYGQTGSLTAQLRNNPYITARGQRIAIEMLRNSQLKVYLRNPFGDVWAVAMNTAQFTRVPGTGLHEAVDVTIEYAEITA